MGRGWVLAPVVAVATAVAEIVVFAAAARAVGAGWAVLLLAGLSVVGLVLLRREGVRAWRRFRAAAQAGRPAGRQVSDGLVGLLGALLLAVPGFVTAALGVLLVLPPTRWAARQAVERVTQRWVSGAVAGEMFGPRRVRVRRGAPVPEQSPRGEARGEAVAAPAIEGEIVEGEIVQTVPASER